METRRWSLTPACNMHQVFSLCCSIVYGQPCGASRVQPYPLHHTASFVFPRALDTCAVKNLAPRICDFPTPSCLWCFFLFTYEKVNTALILKERSTVGVFGAMEGDGMGSPASLVRSDDQTAHAVFVECDAAELVPFISCCLLLVHWLTFCKSTDLCSYVHCLRYALRPTRLFCPRLPLLRCLLPRITFVHRC